MSPIKRSKATQPEAPAEAETQTAETPAEDTPTPDAPEATETEAAAEAAEATDAPEQPAEPEAAADEGPANDEDPVDAPAAADLVERDHREGCPAERTESYPATKPDGTTVTVSHCLDCGGVSYSS